jgi:chaperonin GroES
MENMQTVKNTTVKLPKGLPKPTGYRMILVMPEIETKTKGGIIIPDERKDAENVASVVAYVAAQGSYCYKDPARFDAPWCEVGDWVIIAKYGGSRIKVDGIECRIVNDDSILAVASDPNLIERGGL